MRKWAKSLKGRNANAKQLLINSEPWEVRVALTEGNSLAEFYMERVRGRGAVGNVYKGKVVRVLPGMQAAFVEIGLERTAFLYVSDVQPSSQTLNDESDDLELDANGDATPVKGSAIQDMISEGMPVMVQVAKDPIGTKGARLTCNITLPGRYVVLMPNMEHIGISRRIADEKERQRLRDIIKGLRSPNEGYIVRTVCEGERASKLKEDIAYLQKLWAEIQSRFEKAKAPSMIYRDLNLPLRIVRDQLTDDVKKVIVDSEETYEEVVDFVSTFIPRRRRALQLYQGKESLFDAYRVELELERAMDKKVWLKSGGYIIIEQTEALSAIDVNTGRFVGRSNFDETILKTNLEAVKEVVCQLRLRNIGGIIIIDFIDMDKAAHRDKVYQALEDALKADKARTSISKITSLGLVEMTRKRTQETFGMAMTEACPYCDGSARIKSKASICYEIFRSIKREAAQSEESEVKVMAHPDVANLLYSEEKESLDLLEASLDKRIVVTPDESFHLQHFEVHT